MTAILRKTSDIIDTLINAINAAEHEVLLQTYYLDNDAIGKEFITCLIRARRRGVKVYCLFDALGARGFRNSSEETIAELEGVSIAYFNWLTPWSIGDKRSWFFRNHKRALIIDGKTLYTGGWCIGRQTTDWIDSLLVTDSLHAVTYATSDFKTMCKYSNRKILQFKHDKKFSYSLAPEHIFQYAYQAPRLKSRHIVYTFKNLIQAATKEIQFLVPYFVPERALVKEILKARRRGVSITLHIPQKTDFLTVDIAARTFFEKVLSAGVSICIHPNMIHAKIAIFDQTIFIGSMNLDNISLRYNFENGVFIRDEAILTQLRLDIGNIEKESKRLTLSEWRKRSWWDKFLEKIVGLFRGLL